VGTMLKNSRLMPRSAHIGVYLVHAVSCRWETTEIYFPTIHLSERRIDSVELKLCISEAAKCLNIDKAHFSHLIIVTAIYVLYFKLQFLDWRIMNKPPQADLCCPSMQAAYNSPL
jgi:hypothetical protein